MSIVAPSETSAVPTDWTEARIGDLGIIQTGSTPPTSNRSLYGHSFMFVSPADMGQNKYITRTQKMLSPAGFKQSRRFSRGSVLFVCIGSTIGKIGIAAQDLTSNQQINSITPGSGVDPEYLYYAMSTISDAVKSQAGEQAVPLVNKSDFSDFTVALPGVEEQRRIARALCDSDAMATALERLIAKKQAIKQGMMQQLLTGETRLSGFSEPWQDVTVGDLCTAIGGGGTPSRQMSNFWGGSIPWATIKDITSFNPQDTQEHISRAAMDGSATRLVAAGSLVLATRMTVGKAVVFNVDVCINQDLKALILNRRAVARYLYYWFEHFGHRLARTSGGSTVAGVSTSDIKKCRISAPPENEQNAIAQVLMDVDREINLLRGRLAKALSIKQGMMQELLTGRTRLRVLETAS